VNSGLSLPFPSRLPKTTPSPTTAEVAKRRELGWDRETTLSLPPLLLFFIVAFFTFELLLLLLLLLLDAEEGAGDDEVEVVLAFANRCRCIVDCGVVGVGSVEAEEEEDEEG
jgi:hypothetical protein